MKPHVTLYHDTRREKSDGRYPVKVRITYNRKQKYYPTDTDLNKEEWSKIHGERVSKDFKETKDILFGMLAKAQTICEDMKIFNFHVFEKLFYTVRNYDTSLANMFTAYIDALKKEDRFGSASTYLRTIKSLQEFKPKINFDYITTDLLKQYEKWMLGKDNSITTVGIYLRSLRTILNIAIKDGYFTQDLYPFGRGKYEIPAGKNIKKALTLADVGKIYNYPTTLGTNYDLAKDFWMFTYFCNGINMRDIAHLKYKNMNGEFINFIRAKTEKSTRTSSKPISIYLNDKTKDIIKKWGNEDHSPDNYIFPIIKLEMNAETKYNKINKFIWSVNKYMNLIAKNLEFSTRVTTYTARHTYSTVLKRSGASTEFIGEALGHSNKRTTENYLDSFEQDTQKEFAKKLLDF